ncbi:MAG: hypothetical protein A4E53_00861 [Pelotomaculum sp. PtaB.Bin104]|nr:MAG: hypothetical protein A4E53_00861 [Pelotomaculum sp. PtaB.Bin104]
MRKRSRKLISVLLTLSFLVAMLVPMVGPAGAATTNLVTSTPTYTPNAGAQNLGQLWLYENSDQARSVFLNGQPYDITVTILTNGVEFPTGTAPAVGRENLYMNPLSTIAPGINGIIQADIACLSGTTKTYTFRVTPSVATGTRSGVQLLFPVNISGATSGPIEVEVSAPDSGITGGKFVVGNIAGTGTNAVVLDTATIQVGATNAACGLFRIEEAVVDSLAVGDQIRIDLPADMTWNAATTVTAVGLTVAVGAPATSASGYSRLPITVTANPAGGSRGLITITPRIDVGDDCVKGDVTLSISGSSSNVTSANVVVGSVAEFGVSVSALGDPKTIVAGSIDAEIQGFYIEEGVAGSILGGRTVLIELPSYVRWWNSDPTITTEKGNGTLTVSAAGATSDEQRHIKKYTAGASTVASKFKFERCRVYIDADAPEGDVKATFSGTGGVTGEIVLAKVVKPVTATGGNNKVIIGSANQSVSDIVITEGLKGASAGNPTVVTNATRAAVTTAANNNGWIVLDAPSGVAFAEKPTVEVTEGNIRLEKEGTQLQNNDNQFAIRVSSSSTTPSKIKVSNIKLTLDRTVPEGDLKLGIMGTALDRVTYRNAVNTNDTAVEKVTVATVATPAPADEKATAVFTIGQSKFTLNGTEMTMDVAPYIKNDRTYLPIRFVAQAAGVADSNIMWNEADQSVVLIKGDRVVKLTIGSTTMLINGVSFTMDVAPEIVDPGRTMLPVRWVAQALGCNVDWDEATQTVTVK